MSGAPWNTTETARLRVLALAGLNLSEIATKMERSKTGVHVRAEKLKYSYREISAPQATANEAGNS
jgi:hypothetical protein